MKKKTIASFAVDLIFEVGSSTAFTLTGGMAMFINNAVANHPRLKSVYCHHEQACVAAAEGYAKASNFTKAGFAVVTAGPGVSNTLTPLISAYVDSTPLIILAGQVKSEDIDTFGVRTHGIQEINSKAVISPVVKKFIRITKKNFKKELIETICQAFEGRPGPVFIEIPLDIQSIELNYKSKDIMNLKKIIKLKIKKLNINNLKAKKKFTSAIKKLLIAKRPLLYLGNGCKIAGVEKDVIRFAKYHQIPCVFSWISADIMPFKENLNFGCPGGLAPIYSNQILSEADVVIFLGARLDLATTAFQRKQFGSQAKRFFVDVDKYELSKFSIYKNVFTINLNLSLIKSLIFTFFKKNKKNKRIRLAWLRLYQVKKNLYLAEEERKLSNNKNLNVFKLTRILSELSSNKFFIPASSGYAIETFLRFFQTKTDTRLFLGSALGSMGLGLSHAIGASCFTKKTIICLEADGGLMLNIQELATLRLLNPKKFVLIILNNNGYESIRSSQKKYFNHVVGTDASNGLFIPNFKKISKAYNLKYINISNLKKLKILKSIINSSSNFEPIILDIKIDRNENRGPSVKTLVSSYGKIKSTAMNAIDW